MSATTQSVPTRLRLTRRGRAVLTTLAAAPLVAVVAVLGLSGADAVATSTVLTGNTQSVTVQTGESLWHVAEEVAPDADPRDVVDAVMAVNGLSSAVVYPGQRLDIPAPYAEEASQS